MVYQVWVSGGKVGLIGHPGEISYTVHLQADSILGITAVTPEIGGKIEIQCLSKKRARLDPNEPPRHE